MHLKYYGQILIIDKLAANLQANFIDRFYVSVIKDEI